MYNIKTNVYEGPLDLLLDLIRRNEFDIYDLPIATITQQYLDELKQMEKHDIENTATFLEMTSTLLFIKAQMALPKEEDEDPRQELVKQLVDYQQHKQSVIKMKELKEWEQRFLKREKKQVIKKEKKGNMELLLATYQSILVKKKKQENKMDILLSEIKYNRFTIQGQMEMLHKKMSKPINIAILLEEINDREEVIVTFSAILELIKNQEADIILEAEVLYMVRKDEKHDNN
ncbi:segregation/condensation protein A [Bacillus cereus]